MSEENQSGSTTPDTEPSGQSSETKDVVSYESHAKLLKQLKRQKETMDSIDVLKTENESLRLASQQREEAELTKKGNFQAIIEARDAEIKRLADEKLAIQSERDEATETLTDSYKLNAFLAKIPGKISNDQYLSFVDLKAIGIGEDGRVDNESLSLEVNRFVESHSQLLTPVKMAKLPSGDAKVSDMNITPKGKDAIAAKLREELNNIV